MHWHVNVCCVDEGERRSYEEQLQQMLQDLSSAKKKDQKILPHMNQVQNDFTNLY